MTTPAAIATLSPEQHAAVHHPLGKPAVVDAGAGTGKTFTIVERVAMLHEGGLLSADKILLLTFARKAAAELRGRIAQRLHGVRPHCSTFHAFAWKVLSERAYDIGLSPEADVIEDVDARVIFRNVFREYLQRPNAPQCGFPLRLYNQEEVLAGLFGISQDLKQQGISIAEFRQRALAAADQFARIPFRVIRKPYKTKRHDKDLARISDSDLAREVAEEKARVETAASIFSLFEQHLAERKLLTYADILHRAEAAINANPDLQRELVERYPYCIVDEYQDTDLAQHRLLVAIYGSDLSRVMVVGDVLQSIYAFRGANPENIDLIKATPGAVAYPLVKNRRSLQEILDLAHATITRAHENAARLSGERGSADQQVIEVSSLWTGEKGEHLPADEARIVEAAAVRRQLAKLLDGKHMCENRDGTSTPLTAKDVAILSRTKMNVQPVTEALLSAGIPFRLVGGVGFYDAPEIRDALAWVGLLADPFDAYAIARALQSPVIGLSDVAMTQIAHGLQTDATALSRRVLVESLDAQTLTSPDSRERLTKFHDLVDALAPQAALPLSGALAAVLETTGLLEHWQTSTAPRAPQALANLAKLETLAREFAEKTPGAQALDFIEFIGELERVDYDEREADVTAEDVVTISTIHAAKGMEWPIVFVLGVWPVARSQPRLRLDEQSGALLYAESPDGTRPFHYSVVDEGVDANGVVVDDEDEEKREQQAEERRLFYVALTRARDRVYVSGLRGRPSKANSDGKPHEFLESVYAWFEQRAWVADRPVPEEPVTLYRALVPHDSKARPSSARLVPAEAARAVPPLSYSLVAGYERCPRRITYKLMFRLPEVMHPDSARRAQLGEEDAGESRVPEDSLLKAGEYGSLVHKALELWGPDKRAGAAAASSAAYVEAACRFLDVSPVHAQRHQAESVLARVMQQFAGWTPLHVEAPFTLAFGTEDSPLLVSGFIDLIALDEDGHVCVLDYKSGSIHDESYALQVALYQRAAELVYGLKDALGFIARVAGDSFSVEPVDPVSPETLAQRILRVRHGLRHCNATPRAGAWCFQCPYRGAPCQDYFRCAS